MDSATADSGAADSGPPDAGCDGSVCNGACIDPTSNPDHCGTCNHACTGGTVCSASSCTLLCSASQTLCGVDGGGVSTEDAGTTEAGTTL
jgi:hypothetical protein